MTGKIIALTQPIVDLVATGITDEQLQQAIEKFGNEGVQKSMTSIIDAKARAEFLTWLEQNNIEYKLESGGSCANSAHGCRLLGAEVLCYGSVGNDDFATLFKQDTAASGASDKTTAAEFATSLCFSLVTQDGERTMFTNIEASNFITPQALSEDDFNDGDILFMEGYMFYVPLEGAKNTIDTAIKYARNKGAKVALSLSDPFCVTVNKARFEELIEGGSIDILFANEEEAKTYTGQETARIALQKLAEKVETVAVTLGENGSMISHNGQVTQIEAAIVPKLQIIDATGVGDIYAGTILCGLLFNKSMEEAGDLASRLAAEVITQRGARLKKEGMMGNEGCCGQPQSCSSHG